MSNHHNVILIPGLGDDVKMMRMLTSHWKKCGLEVIIHPIGWRDNEEKFTPKLSRLVGLVDKLSVDPSSKVSVVGISAGGSAALNALFERQSKIHKVINVCGRLRGGQIGGFRGLRSRTTSSNAFAQSIAMLESREPIFGNSLRQKIMTVRALFGDELVPANTVALDGARNITIPTIEHVISIYAALTIFSEPLIRFLTK